MTFAVSRGAGSTIAALSAAFGLTVVLLATPAFSEDTQPTTGTGFQLNPQMVALGEQIWKLKATCRSCHGALGNGVGDIPQEPQGANFRETILSPEAFEEAIQCGRPGTAMPHFDPRAYQDDRCYGLVAADLGTDLPPSGGTLSPRERDAITQFVFANFVGKPAPTYEECLAFWGEGASTCTRYPEEAD
jgi:mono/diheme cytochrome c family protein